MIFQKGINLQSQINQKLKNASEDIELSINKKSMDPEENVDIEDGKEKIPLNKFMQSVNDQLTTGHEAIKLKAKKGTLNVDPIDIINKYSEKNDFYNLANMLYELNSILAKKQIDTADLKKEWQDKIVKPFEKMITSWNKEIYPVLHLHTPGHPSISQNISQENYASWRAPFPPHLGEPEYKKYREGKKEFRLLNPSSKTKPDGAPLAWIALDVKDINEYFKKINAQLATSTTSTKGAQTSNSKAKAG